jgi:hypothetical protein
MVSAIWSFVELAVWPVDVVLRVMPGAVARVPAYFAGLLATSAVVCVVFQLECDVTSKQSEPSRPRPDLFGPRDQ